MKTALLRRRAGDRAPVIPIQNFARPARAPKIDGVLGDRPVNAPDQVIVRRIIRATCGEQTQGGQKKQATHASLFDSALVRASENFASATSLTSGLPTNPTLTTLLP